VQVDSFGGRLVLTIQRRRAQTFTTPPQELLSNLPASMGKQIVQALLERHASFLRFRTALPQPTAVTGEPHRIRPGAHMAVDMLLFGPERSRSPRRVFAML